MKIDVTGEKVVFDGSEPNVDRTTGEVRTTPEGVNKWYVYVLVKEDGEVRSRQYRVNMVGQKDPAAGIEHFQPVTMKRFRLNEYIIDGKTVNSYSADSIAKA